jgi:transposase
VYHPLGPWKAKEDHATPYFVGLDVSKKTTSVCVTDRDGAIVQEGVVETSPNALVGFLRGDGRRYIRVGMETGTLSAWLYEGLTRNGLPVVCVENRSAHSIMKVQRNKTDRNDARGIAALMRQGSYRAVHIKSAASQQARAMIAARQLLIEKARDVANSIRSLLLGLGLKLDAGRPTTFAWRAKALAAPDDFANRLVEPLLNVLAALQREKAAIEASLLQMANADPVCRRLTTAPGIGPLTALIFRSAVDQPRRFAKSRLIGVHFGLTSRTFQSGGSSVQGRITRWGDGTVRRALVMAAWTLMKKTLRRSWLSDWVAEIAARRGGGRAMVAGARRLAIILHRMWITETDFQWEASMKA